MSVLNVTLLAIGAPLVILLMAVPMILLIKGWGAWRDVPREIYDSHRQRLLGLQPTSFWMAAALIGQGGRIFEWFEWQSTRQITDDVSLAIIAVVLVYELLWAVRIVRSRVGIDVRLVRFARYALWGSAVYLLAVAACLAGNLMPK
jgi:hypothetical protein